MTKYQSKEEIKITNTFNSQPKGDRFLLNFDKSHPSHPCGNLQPLETFYSPLL